MGRKSKNLCIATGILAIFVIVLLHFDSQNNFTDMNEEKAITFTTKGSRIPVFKDINAKPSIAQEQPPINVTIFLESFKQIDNILAVRRCFTQFEASYPKACPLPDGGTCTIQHSNSSADVVFRIVRAVSNHPLRYWPGQILAVLNLEANRGAYGIYPGGFRQLEIADIRIDHHPTSDIFYAEMCRYFSIDVLEKPPPDPKKRRGIAMFSSDCNVPWEGFPERKKYYLELMKYVHIDQYGKCWHNVDSPQRKGDDWKEAFVEIASKYRMIVAFENIIQKDYISAKLPLIFRSGAIPVYRGPPEAYQWIPGNHSIIDADKYTSPKELADYLKRVSEDDQLFRYHTTNFNLKQANETWNRLCAREDYMCMTCKLAHKMKKQRILTKSNKNS